MKENFKNNKKIFCFPIFAGVVCSLRNRAVFCQIKKQGVIYLKTCEEKEILKHNIPFVRGIEFLFFSIIFYAKYFLFSVKNYFNYEEKKSTVKFLFLLLGVFFCLVIAWVFLGVIPAKVGVAIFSGQNNIFFNNFCVAVVRCIMFAVLCFCFEVFSDVRMLWKFNTAGNMALSNKNFCALNFFNIIFLSLMLDFFVVTLLGITLSAILKIVVSVLILAICISLGFEICLWEESSKRKVKIISKFFGLPFFVIPEKIEQEIANCAIMEMDLIKKEEKRPFMDIVSNANEVPLALVLSEVKTKLKNAGIEDFGEAEWLVALTLDCKKLDLKLITAISCDKVEKIKDVLERRIKHEPLDKIFGETEFFGLTFKVNNFVLTPRQETELLVEQVLKEIGTGDANVLDLCTGSGAIAISVAKNSSAEVVAVDISEEALLVAKENAQINDAKNVKFKQSDLFSNVKFKKFDIIVSNPPYIKTEEIATLDKEVKNFDPMLALDGGEDGLYFYKKIIKTAPQFLAKSGKIMFEVGQGQAQKIKKLLTDGFCDIKIMKDFGGVQRIVIATKKDKKC